MLSMTSFDLPLEAALHIPFIELKVLSYFSASVEQGATTLII